jgi:hypothetical protein
MTCFRLVLCAVLLHAATAFAADDTGKFAMKGAGFLPCQVFVAEREKQSKIYYLIGGWIEGYIAAHNRYVENTYDVLSFETLELLLSVTQNHCQSNPDDRLHAVLGSMIAKLSPHRLQEESPKVEIAEGERKAQLYQETIRRIQTELARRGLYKNAIDGRFTDATRSALIAFQSDIDFEATGFPDQTTLWRLLRK